MSIEPICIFCKKELNDFGAILISPPDEFDKVRDKIHVCQKCYIKMSELIVGKDERATSLEPIDEIVLFDFVRDFWKDYDLNIGVHNNACQFDLVKAICAKFSPTLINLELLEACKRVKDELKRFATPSHTGAQILIAQLQQAISNAEVGSPASQKGVI